MATGFTELLHRRDSQMEGMLASIAANLDLEPISRSEVVNGTTSDPFGGDTQAAEVPKFGQDETNPSSWQSAGGWKRRFHAEMDGHTHIAMEWKDQSPRPDCSMLPSFLTDPSPRTPWWRIAPATTAPRGLGSRGTAFQWPWARLRSKGSRCRRRHTSARGPVPGAASPSGCRPELGSASPSSTCVTANIQEPSRLTWPSSPASSLRRWWNRLCSTLMPWAEASPTSGKLLMLGDTNNNNNTRLEPPSIEDGPGAFSFKPLDIKSSQYSAEGKKGSLPNSQHPLAPSRDVPVKTNQHSDDDSRRQSAVQQPSRS